MVAALAMAGKLQHFPVMVLTMVLVKRRIRKHNKNKALCVSFIIEWE